ncbi:MAG: 3-phosphoshikimate 1-carboxyvinyltransferase [Epsilonproteobacteria bacterium]|nr:3-phosphoshikimate 1-carboxyvinyltransferase [Campylobacterota bacterium]
MKIAKVSPITSPLKGEISDIAADKSISHRCAIFSLLSDRDSLIENFLLGEDTLASLDIIQKVGAKVKRDKDRIQITPPKEIKEPFDILDCKNAGTAMRLFMGLFSSIEGSFVLTGDKYLRNRPMRRVADPLKSIGAKIDGREFGNKAPLHIRGGKLKAFKFESKIDSAQVKSAMILAALHADGTSYYKENFLSRDHSERMLKGMGAKIKNVKIDQKEFIEIKPLDKPLDPIELKVPSDPSSAFFFGVAAAIVPNSQVTLKNVSLNPTRVEAFEVLKKMGADVEFILKENKFEPIGDIIVSYSKELKGVEISKNIPWLIDELPALSIAMAFAKGESIVKNAKELRVKESDRIKSVVDNLRRCNIEVDEFEDGYRIQGGDFKGALINSYGDHRIAMSFAIAGLKSKIEIEDVECVDTSFPNFFEILGRFTKVDIYEN